MSLNLEDYIKVYENFIPKDVCRNILGELDKVVWQQNLFYDPETKELNPPEPDGYENCSMYIGDLNEQHAVVLDMFWKAIHKYMVELNKECFHSWRGFSIPRYNRYEEGQGMKKHCDHIHNLFDGEIKGVPILSVLAALNDDYEGGEFIMFDDHKIDLKVGSIMVFPSIFLYEHEVKPVTKGVRHTCVSWVF